MLARRRASSASASPTRPTTSWPASSSRPREALAEQRRVLGDHDSHGSTASIRVPRPDGLSSASVPPCGGDAVGEAGRPAPGRGARRRAVVGDHQAQRAVRALGARRPARRARVLDRVGDRLAGDEVRGRLDRRRRRGPPDASTSTGTGALRARSSSAAASPSSSRGGRTPGGDRAQVGDRRADLVDRAVERRRSAALRAGASAGAAAARCRADQPLLRAVVQVALEPPALLVAGARRSAPATPRPRRAGSRSSARRRASSTASAAASSTPRSRSGGTAGSCSSTPTPRGSPSARGRRRPDRDHVPAAIRERVGGREAEEDLGARVASATRSTAPTSSASARPSRTSSRNARSSRTPSKRARAKRRSTSSARGRAMAGRRAPRPMWPATPTAPSRRPTGPRAAPRARTSPPAARSAARRRACRSPGGRSRTGSAGSTATATATASHTWTSIRIARSAFGCTPKTRLQSDEPPSQSSGASTP